MIIRQIVLKAFFFISFCCLMSGKPVFFIYSLTYPEKPQLLRDFRIRQAVAG